MTAAEMEARVARTATELIPKLRAHFAWYVSAIPANAFQLHRVVEYRPGGVAVDWTMTFAGIKEIVKGGPGETAIAIPKPHHYMLVVVVAPGATIDTLALAPALARRVAGLLGAPNNDRRIETHLPEKSGLVVTGTDPASPGKTTGAEVWSITWP